jgi:flagellar basal-body rod modification protein FlgD
MATVIDPNSATSTTPVQSKSSSFSQMTSTDFLKVLFTQLQNQDPTKPTDSNELLQQLSTIRNIESQVSLQSQLSSLVLQNQVSSAGNLIGKVVEGLDSQNASQTGQVTSVRVDNANNKVVLQLDSGVELDMSKVRTISAASPGGTATTPTPTPTPTATAA